MLAIRSIELARYLSGIMPIALLFSSSSCCTRVNFRRIQGHCDIPWFPYIPPNEVLKAPIRGSINSEAYQNILFVPLPSFGVNETANEIQ
jgi:hypothetical protein